MGRRYRHYNMNDQNSWRLGRSEGRLSSLWEEWILAFLQSEKNSIAAAVWRIGGRKRPAGVAEAPWVRGGGTPLRSCWDSLSPYTSTVFAVHWSRHSLINTRVYTENNTLFLHVLFIFPLRILPSKKVIWIFTSAYIFSFLLFEGRRFILVGDGGRIGSIIFSRKYTCNPIFVRG